MAQMQTVTLVLEDGRRVSAAFPAFAPSCRVRFNRIIVSEVHDEEMPVMYAVSGRFEIRCGVANEQRNLEFARRALSIVLHDDGAKEAVAVDVQAAVAAAMPEVTP